MADDLANSLSDLFNTGLSPKEEAAFQAWLAQNNRSGDLADYDMRGAWKAGVRGQGHFPDTWKKPNHPTFSDESIYSTPQSPGGRWTGADQSGWTFWASPQNFKYRTLGQLMDYFSRAEPGNQFVIQSDWSLPSG